MIEEQHGDMTLLCDECDVELDKTFDAEDEFKAMIAYAKSEGWKVFQSKGEWMHNCPDCAVETSHDSRQLGMFDS